MILIEDIDTEDERGQELVTTTFIFPELALLSLNSASLSLPITPVSPVRIKFVSLAREGSRFGEVHDISHFPPIKLTISLPDGYPSNAPPDVELESLWVPNAALERLKSEIRHIWEDVRDQVVFAVIDHLSQAAERTFDLAEKLWKEDGSWEHLLHLPGEIQDELVSFNRAMLKETFDKGTYDCGVCLGKYIRSYTLL